MANLSAYTLNAKIRETPDVELHRGYRNLDGTPVVVKLLRSEQPTALELARLRHEHQLLQSLDVPQVVKSLGLETLGHRLALVLEDAGDTSLDQLIQSAQLDLERCLRLAIVLARVVATVHGHGIVHKDIKPAHFFVRPGLSEDLVLVDFGIATRLSHQVQAAALVTELEGTLPYIAPEQTGRMNRVVDWRSDLYSLGVTLYELFTGRLPFETTDPLELVHSHIARAPPPPQTFRPDLPPVAAGIILKLMAKVAEERYQSASGVQHDLELCLDQLHKGGRIDSFPLGEHDISGQLSIPQKLYGREAEMAELLATFERVRQGRAELLLLSGSAGIGKSALVNDLQKQLVRGGYFVAGKFDYLDRSVPYGPLAHAFRSLVRTVLAEPPAALASRKEALLAAVGANGQLLIDLVPELELVIGPQPSVPALGPSESQHRFQLVFLNFVRAFTASEQPLVLFLDDLQWADANSLRLLQEVLTASSLGYLLVLGAFRQQEVDTVHPLSLMVEELARAGTAVHELTVQPLELAPITQLLCETLAQPAETVLPFGRVLLEKTGGNPFFISQFLTALHRDGRLVYSETSRAWQWDLAQVRARLATDNVVDLVLSLLKQLPLATQELLRSAACIGHQFDAHTLAVVSECPQRDVTARLWEAMRQGLIVPLDGNYRYSGEEAGATVAQGQTAIHSSYRFLHDRVQQAAYSLISEDQRAAVHLRIGRLLLAPWRDEPSEAELFRITDHLNRGATLLVDATEKRRLARLNLLAGRKARDAAAPGSAVHYLAAALDLLGDAGWSTSYDLACPVHLVKAECEYLTGNLQEALHLLEVVEERAHTTLERVAARNLGTMLLTKTGQLAAACVKTTGTLHSLGSPLPTLDDRGALGAAIGAEFAAYQASLAAQGIESLANAPPLTDPTQLALLETMATGIPAAFNSIPELHVLLVLKGVHLLRHTTAALAGFFYEQYAIVHLVITGDQGTAFRFGQLGLDLAKRAGNPASSGPVHFLFGGFIAHWRQPLSHSLDLLRSGMRLSLELGDQIHAAYCATFIIHYRLYAGDSLEEVAAAIQPARELANRAGDLVNQDFCRICQQTVAALTGQTKQPGSLDGGDFEEAAFEAAAPAPALAFYGTAKAMVRYLAGRYSEALTATEQWPLLPGIFYHAEHTLYRALSLAQVVRAAPAEERETLRQRLRSDAETLRTWAESGPANHAHRAALVGAELAAVEGRRAEAMDLFERAVAQAHEHGFLHEEALANDLAARYYLALGLKKLAGPYLADAQYAYQRWGATAKVAELVATYPQATPVFGVEPTTGVGTQLITWQGPDAILTSTQHSAGRLDLTTAIRATEAIATELVLDRLLERLMRTLLENAGAQRGCLVLEREGHLRLEATVTIDPDAVKLGVSELVTESQAVPATLVQYVARTRETVVLDDAARDARFARDPYVARVHPKSVLCLGMLQRGQLMGVLYLENNVATHAFSPARTELLQFLAAQAAVAFENAKLYGELQTTSDELRRANENLEGQVAERTAELRRTLAELWSEMDLARKIQTVLLPKQTRLPDYDMAATMLPADSVGGDYYDVVEAGHRSWVLIGDVSGHGVTAGLIMMMIQTAVRTIVLTAQQAREPLSPAQVLTRANRAVRDNLLRIGPDQYMTITALELGPGIVRYSGLHQDILVYRGASDSVERLETRGLWVGIEDDISGVLEDDTIALEPGDILLLFTDGISELPTEGQMLGTSGLAERFHALATQGLDPASIVQGVMSLVAGRAIKDDVTVMVLRYAPARTSAKAAE